MVGLTSAEERQCEGLAWRVRIHAGCHCRAPCLGESRGESWKRESWRVSWSCVSRGAIWRLSLEDESLRESLGAILRSSLLFSPRAIERTELPTTTAK